MKKLFSLMLALFMAASVGAVGTVSAGAAAEDELSPGQFNTHGKYRKSQDKIVTQHLMFAMPPAWQNDLTRDPQCNGAAGMYWWTGWDNPEDNLPHGWPGYECDKVAEEGVDNLYSIDAPNFGNGEKGNGTFIIWNNNLDGGTETDPAKNPFRKAAQQTRDFQAGYYSRYDKNEKYEPLFRYIYKYNLEKLGAAAAADLDIKSETFWEDINKVAAAFNSVNYDSLDNNEKTYCVDLVLDENDLDFSVFGDYASNFFNSDTVSEIYPEEEDGESCISFHFDNMVFVVNFDPEKMVPSPISGKIGYDGDFFFYYGNGDYGTWPTKELNEEMDGYAGNFTGDYPPELPYPWLDPSPSDEPVSGTIYFRADTSGWQHYKNITCYIVNQSTGEQLITWGSKKANMTDEGNGLWSYDLSAWGISLFPDINYDVIFTADWGAETCELILDGSNIGDTAYCTGETVEATYSYNRQVAVVKWKSGRNGNPVRLGSTGNVLGDTFRCGETPYSVFKDFLMFRVGTAVQVTGKSYQDVIDETAYKLGLSADEVKRAIEETGRYPDSFQGDKVTRNGMVFTKWSENTYILTDYTGSSSNLEIPKTLRVPVYHGGLIGDEVQRITYETYPVTAIGDWAFANNKTLQYVHIPETICSVGKGAFYNCVSLQYVRVPDSVDSLGANAFEKCLYLEAAVLGDGITEIKDETFFDCRRLKAVNIPDGVTAIGAEAFYNCRSLSKAALPNGVKSIGGKGVSDAGAFEECRSLETLLIPDSVTEIAENTFEHCDKLTLYGTKRSFAERFAADAAIAFKNVGNITASAHVIGDIDGDLELTVNDVTRLQRYLAEMLGSDAPDITDPKVLAYVDADGDGNVSIADVTIMQRFLAEMIESFR